MNVLSTLDPPGFSAYFDSNAILATNVSFDYSLGQARIRSAFEGAQRELSRYKEYSSRWDGYRAEPFDPKLLGDTSKILALSELLFVSAGVLPELVTTGPASDGSIDVEIEAFHKRVVLTLYPGESELRLMSADNRERHEETVSLGSHALAEWFTWLHHADPVPVPLDRDRIDP